MTLLDFTLSLLVLSLWAVDQTATNQTLVDPRPSDARMNQFEEPKGTSWKVFAVESYSDGPLAITEVQEVRQQNPPSAWVAFARNRSLMPVASYRLAAAIVSGDGNVKAIQQLPVMRNVPPGKVSRQETRVTVAVLMPTDRVVFFVSDVLSELGSWKSTNTDIAALIKSAAKQLPVP